MRRQQPKQQRVQQQRQEQRSQREESSKPKNRAQEVLDQAVELQTRFEYDKAKLLYERALRSQPNHPGLLDAYADLLLNMQLPHLAVPVLQQSIQVAPDTGTLKYLNLGQITEGHDSLQYYEKAINLLLSERNLLSSAVSTTTTTPSDTAPFVFQAVSDESRQRISELDAQLSGAFCSIAELYLTDLCMEEDAEKRCEGAIEKSLAYDPTNAEALQTKASFFVSAQKPDQAKALLQESIQLWINTPDPMKRPLYSVRIATCKLLIELGENEEAVNILQMLLEEDDSNDETWYLLTLAALHSNQPLVAQQAASTCLDLLKKQGCPSSEPYFKEVKELLVKADELVQTLPPEELQDADGEEIDYDNLPDEQDGEAENVDEAGDDDEWEDVEDEDMEDEE